MTNKEVNIAVARKLGWTPKEGHDGDKVCWTAPDGRSCLSLNFCTSITAAWEVVHFVKLKCLTFSLWNCGGDGLWKCVIDGCIEETSESDSMCICLAFLKLPS